MQLHAFSDASEKAYGCTIYARFISVDHQIVCRLVMAKARVAPPKASTIPRLELTAAALAVKLTENVRSACRLDWDSIHFWTNSMIVWYYIRNTSFRFGTFVANRISEIREHSTLEQWNHVIGALNPVDLVSRQAVNLRCIFK